MVPYKYIICEPRAADSRRLCNVYSDIRWHINHGRGKKKYHIVVFFVLLYCFYIRYQPRYKGNNNTYRYVHQRMMDARTRIVGLERVIRNVSDA